MDTIIEFGGRRSGRTTRILEWLREGERLGEKRVMIVHSIQEASRLRKIVEEEEGNSIERWQIHALVDNPSLGKRYSEVAIDNLELILPRFAAPITLITATLAEKFPYAHSHGFKPEFPVQFRHNA